jgi:hypothetical protein
MTEGLMNNKQRDGIESGKGLELASIMECSECTCFSLRKAARVVTQIFDNA